MVELPAEVTGESFNLLLLPGANPRVGQARLVVLVSKLVLYPPVVAVVCVDNYEAVGLVTGVVHHHVLNNLNLQVPHLVQSATFRASRGEVIEPRLIAVNAQRGFLPHRVVGLARGASKLSRLREFGNVGRPINVRQFNHPLGGLVVH